ncbi:hypothetical protein [Salinibacter ruber]|uniref:Uncharacterized protein n=1 Tax=Salinibacter ruber TaxID=146919 RepID=A0A9X2QDA9_9BACT|nr:hypothetical protein [Salinibacter ruber]MCS3661163.1 hypothetical protein [Salinibacter ruber]MCS3710962.1 hypothetical protein [Salinibacter ruber]
MSEKKDESKNVRYSGYWPGDEVRSVKFFRTLGYNHTLDFWRWSNRTRLIQYAEKDQSIIAHYGVQPKLIRIGNSNTQGGLGIHFGAHPEYGNVPVLLETLNRIEKRCRKIGIKFLFGFPNNNSWPFLNRMVGWKKVSDITALTIPLGKLEKSSNKTDKFPEFKRWHSLKHSEFHNEGSVRVEKDVSQLEWRYKECPNEAYFIVEREREGFLILKTYMKEKEKHGHILEWGVNNNDKKTQKNLVIDAANVFRRKNVDIVSTWMNKSHQAFRVLEELGFERSGFTTHFGYKPLSPDVPNLEKYNWLISMGDSDAF